MKKSIVIVVVIALVILGAVVWISQSKPLDGTISNLQAAKATNQVNLTDSVLNEATLNVFVDVGNYYQKNNAGVFENDASSTAYVLNYLAGLKNQYGISTEYYIHSTNTNFVVKVRQVGASDFYCMDTVNPNTTTAKPTIIQSTTAFNDTTDCSGTILK